MNLNYYIYFAFQENCEKIGGYLVEIDSVWEHEYIRSQLDLRGNTF